MIKYVKHFESEKIFCCFYIDNKIQGLGFIFKSDAIACHREIKYDLEIRFLYIVFWMLCYKKTNKKFDK